MTTTTGQRGGARANSGPDPKFTKEARLGVGIEQTLFDEMEEWRRRPPNLIEMKTNGRSKRFPDCPEGFQPPPRSDVVTHAFQHFFGAAAPIKVEAEAKPGGDGFRAVVIWDDTLWERGDTEEEAAGKLVLRMNRELDARLNED